MKIYYFSHFESKNNSIFILEMFQLKQNTLKKHKNCWEVRSMKNSCFQTLGSDQIGLFLVQMLTKIKDKLELVKA